MANLLKMLDFLTLRLEVRVQIAKVKPTSKAPGEVPELMWRQTSDLAFNLI